MENLQGVRDSDIPSYHCSGLCRDWSNVNCSCLSVCGVFQIAEIEGRIKQVTCEKNGCVEYDSTGVI